MNSGSLECIRSFNLFAALRSTAREAARLSIASPYMQTCASMLQGKLVVAFSEGGNARHFFFGPLLVAGSRLQAMLFQTFKLAHSAKVRRETGNKKKGACGCFL